MSKIFRDNSFALPFWVIGRGAGILPHIAGQHAKMLSGQGQLRQTVRPPAPPARQAGEPHAEILALRKAGVKARRATLYLNLEPCTHYGKTPPYVPAVIEAGVDKVVVGMEDPNPLVKGKGVDRLKQAGLDVNVGVLEKECRRLNEAFCKYILHQEPFVILKAAATLDGKLATRNGESKWITGEDARRFVHRLRNQADGVIVGIGSVLKEDPMLTARIRGGRDPYRIILDSRLRISENAKVIELNHFYSDKCRITHVSVLIQWIEFDTYLQRR